LPEFRLVKVDGFCYRLLKAGMNCASYESRVDTRSAAAVRAEAIKIFQRIFPGSDPALIKRAFAWVEDAFAGRYADYQPIDAKYHDFEHTLQGTLCFVRLLEGYQRARAQPPLTARMFELAVVAILLHDTGYLKTREDRQGTGAKYTLIHVGRSAEFAGRLMAEQNFEPGEIRAVQNMIRCTGVNTDLESIPFQSDLERKVGFALGTADLLGQMAAEDYPDKLGILFQEFEESNRFNNKQTGPGVFKSADELRESTPAFWERYVVPKINFDFVGLYQFLKHSDGENPYLARIESNIARLKQEMQQVDTH
jgi:hypothetical protein